MTPVATGTIINRDINESINIPMVLGESRPGQRVDSISSTECVVIKFRINSTENEGCDRSRDGEDTGTKETALITCSGMPLKTKVSIMVDPDNQSKRKSLQ
jgi:hypothetical protein